MGVKRSKKIVITRDPLKRNGAYLINGTRLAVTDIMYAIWRGDAEYLELEMDIKDITSAIKEWVERKLSGRLPAFLLNCINHLDTDRECAIKLAKAIELLEAYLRHKELGNLHEILTMQSKPKEKSIEYKWLVRMREFFPDNPMQGIEQAMSETFDVIRRLSKEIEESIKEKAEQNMPT
ncbi:MAG: hypothetical protein RMK35_05785 [Aquificaceae bacterium]|nr:hypothetical protein [Aquificaceae bacterium]MDW8434298.1 hypothetical protein [Aquificaceae bacterium]